MGHEIGLHFDASFYSAKDDLNHACKKEISILEKVISRKVNIISFHRPSKIMLNITSFLGNLGRQSGQCKPPARFLLGWTTTCKT